MRAQEVGLHGHGANLMADIEETDEMLTTPTQTPGVLPMPIPGATGEAGRGRDASVSSTRTSSLSVPPGGSRRVNPSFAAPEGLEKVQLVVKWGGEVRRCILRLFDSPVSLKPDSLFLFAVPSIASRPTRPATNLRISARTSRRTSRL